MANHPPPSAFSRKKSSLNKKHRWGGINLEDYSETHSIEWTDICFEISNSKNLEQCKNSLHPPVKYFYTPPVKIFYRKLSLTEQIHKHNNKLFY